MKTEDEDKFVARSSDIMGTKSNSCEYFRRYKRLVWFQQDSFSSTPYILLTAVHKVLGQKHDAATVWVENAKAGGFTACLREMQNFDGLHENIEVVSKKNPSFAWLWTSFDHFLFKVAESRSTN